MKTKDGFTLYKNEDSGWGYYMKEYIVDGQNPEDNDPANIEKGLFDMFPIDYVATKAEALAVVRKHKKEYYKIVVYENLVETSDFVEYGNVEKYCTVRQSIYDFVNGKLLRKF